jgi:hypothetical protein
LLVHIVLDNIGKHGRAYRATDEATQSDARGRNTAEGWARDVSEDIARTGDSSTRLLCRPFRR